MRDLPMCYQGLLFCGSSSPWLLLPPPAYGFFASITRFARSGPQICSVGRDANGSRIENILRAILPCAVLAPLDLASCFLAGQLPLFGAMPSSKPHPSISGAIALFNAVANSDTHLPKANRPFDFLASQFAPKANTLVSRSFGQVSI